MLNQLLQNIYQLYLYFTDAWKILGILYFTNSTVLKREWLHFLAPMKGTDKLADDHVLIRIQ
jgi:hypothetical protein